MEQPEELVQAGYRYALSLTHHHYDAQDLVQQAWMRCFNRYGEIRNRSMLYTTIRNLFWDQCRRSRIVRFEALDEADGVAEGGASGALPACDDLDILLAGLRVEEREALFLNAVEGFTASEISDHTGQPRNTILSLIHRAKAKLKKSLARAEEKALRQRARGDYPEDKS